MLSTVPIKSITARQSMLVNVVSGVPQGRVLGPLLFLLYTSDFFSLLENKPNSYADDYFDGCCGIPRLQNRSSGVTKP